MGWSDVWRWGADGEWKAVCANSGGLPVRRVGEREGVDGKVSPADGDDGVSGRAAQRRTAEGAGAGGGFVSQGARNESRPNEGLAVEADRVG